MEMPYFDRKRYYSLLDRTYFNHLGRIAQVVGISIESVGPEARLGDLCEIIINEDSRLMAEVVGFKGKRLILMPYDSAEGVSEGCLVENTGRALSIPVGDALLGHTLDGIGRPTDTDEDLGLTEVYPAEADPPDPMKRVVISEPLSLGVKAVDGLLNVGKVQLIGIFAGSGVG